MNAVVGTRFFRLPRATMQNSVGARPVCAYDNQTSRHYFSIFLYPRRHDAIICQPRGWVVPPGPLVASCLLYPYGPFRTHDLFYDLSRSQSYSPTSPDPKTDNTDLWPLFSRLRKYVVRALRSPARTSWAGLLCYPRNVAESVISNLKGPGPGPIFRACMLLTN